MDGALSNSTLQWLALAAVGLHIAALVAVFLFRQGFKPIAMLNMVIAVAVLAYLAPRFFSYGFPFDSFQFLLLVGELVTFTASWLALLGAARAPYATFIAWAGFCGNFLLSAGLFWLAFFFRMTRLF